MRALFYHQLACGAAVALVRAAAARALLARVYQGHARVASDPQTDLALDPTPQIPRSLELDFRVCSSVQVFFFIFGLPLRRQASAAKGLREEKTRALGSNREVRLASCYSHLFISSALIQGGIEKHIEIWQSCRKCYLAPSLACQRR